MLSQQNKTLVAKVKGKIYIVDCRVLHYAKAVTHSALEYSVYK